MSKERELLCDLGLNEAIVYDNPDYDAAIIGTTNDGRVVYDYDKMVECLVNDQKWSEEDSREWIDYNALGAYFGPGTPIIMFPLERYEE